MNTQVDDIINALLAEVSAELGGSYSQLAYVENVEQNSFRTNNDRYGIRARAASQVPGVTKMVTLTQQFELILTKGYYVSNLDDNNKVSTAQTAIGLVFDIYKRFVVNRGGLPLVILNINNLLVSEPSYLDESKVSVIRATLDITYRYSLI
jgi:hypothetical protein